MLMIINNSRFNFLQINLINIQIQLMDIKGYKINL